MNFEHGSNNQAAITPTFPAWHTTAGGGDSYPCRCQNGGDYLTVDLLDVSLVYIDILGPQHVPKQVPL